MSHCCACTGVCGHTSPPSYCMKHGGLANEELGAIARKILRPIEIEYNPVTKPKHYNEHPSRIECIQITEHMNFCLGNAMKYIWRADLKNGVEDLKKAVWYLNREIARREK